VDGRRVAASSVESSGGAGMNPWVPRQPRLPQRLRRLRKDRKERHAVDVPGNCRSRQRCSREDRRIDRVVCDAFHQHRGASRLGRILGVLALAREYGVAVVGDAGPGPRRAVRRCLAALARGDRRLRCDSMPESAQKAGRSSGRASAPVQPDECFARNRRIDHGCVQCLSGHVNIHRFSDCGRCLRRCGRRRVCATPPIPRFGFGEHRLDDPTQRRLSGRRQLGELTALRRCHHRTMPVHPCDPHQPTAMKRRPGERGVCARPELTGSRTLTNPGNRRDKRFGADDRAYATRPSD
jgi:hypothetical protein